MNNKKVYLIPGWLNTKGMFNENAVLEIWRDKIGPENKIEADYIIGHSIGCNWALMNWLHNKNTKLILVNPLFPKRSLLNWFLRWREFKSNEIPPKSKKVVSNFDSILFGIKQCYHLLRTDFDSILKEIPKTNITILWGEKDIFYGDKLAKDYISTKNIRTITVKEAGHNWSSRFDEAIERIIK